MNLIYFSELEDEGELVLKNQELALDEEAYQCWLAALAEDRESDNEQPQ